MKKFILLSFFLSFSTVSKTFVQVDVDTNRVVSVNQHIPFTITVLTDDYFTGAPDYRLPDIDGALVMQQDTDTVSSFTTVQDIKYTSQSWTFDIYPTREGVISIPAINIQANVEGEKIKSATQPYTLLVKKPEAMQDISDFLVSDQVDISQTWEGVKSSYEVGDVITRVVEIKANNTSQLVMPDFSPTVMDGFSFFMAEPELSDVYHRSDHYAMLKQLVTYTIQSAGTYQLGGEVISWWDPKAEQKSTYQFETISIKSGFSFVQFLHSYWIAILIICVVLTLLGLLIFYTIRNSKKWMEFFNMNSHAWLSHIYWHVTKNFNHIALFRQIYRDQNDVEALMVREYKDSNKSSFPQRVKWLFKRKKKYKN